MALAFEWDPGKARLNLLKHGVTFAEATSVFGDPHSLTIPDPAHSQAEDRFIVLGASHRDRMLVVSYTERAGGIRLISARRASRRERVQYEEEGS